MEKKEAILLQNHFMNKMKIDGELGWFTREYNAATGYFWNCTPDNSGVYEMVEELILHPSTEVVGVPGQMNWKFKAVKKGKGTIMFELNSPSGEQVQQIIIGVDVNN